MKPTFICIGVQKSGTTSLINYMNSNPEIYMIGETHFFDNNNYNNIKLYESKFKTNKKIIGEKTPSYCYLRYAIDRIYNYNKNIKLIIIFREPIQRAFSQYNMYLNNNNKTLNDVTESEILKFFSKFENEKLDNITQNGHYFISRGYYDEILNYIYSKFNRNQVFIGISEEIFLNKNEEYNKIFSFLGAKNYIIDKNNDVHIRKYSKNIPINLRKKLYTIYKSHNEKFYEIIGRKISLWEKYYIDNDLQ